MTENFHEWHVAQDGEGFFLENEYGEEVLPHWLPHLRNTGWRCQSHKIAHEVLNQEIQYAIDNYEPPDPPGFEGGFAENH